MLCVRAVTTCLRKITPVPSPIACQALICLHSCHLVSFAYLGRKYPFFFWWCCLSVHVFQYISVYIVNGDVVVIVSNDAFIFFSLSFSTLCSKILLKKSVDNLPCRYLDWNQGRRYGHRTKHIKGAKQHDKTDKKRYKRTEKHWVHRI